MSGKVLRSTEYKYEGSSHTICDCHCNVCRHAKTGLKPERDTGSIILKPGTAKNKCFPGYETNFRYIGEVKNGLDRVTVVTSTPIPKYSDIQKRPIVFNNCTEDLQWRGARTRSYPHYETYKKCNRVLAQARFYQSQ